MASSKSVVPLERIEKYILLIRGQKVMLDRDLAALYEVPTKRLNEQVKRNRERFPEDFMFQLTKKEVETLNRSQIATGSEKHRDPKSPPYAFTEQGVAMLSSVLRSKRAVQVNIQIMRTFVELRQLLASHSGLARKLAELEQKYDSQFKAVFDAIRKLMAPELPPKRRRIGFDTDTS